MFKTEKALNVKRKRRKIKIKSSVEKSEKPSKKDRMRPGWKVKNALYINKLIP